MASKEKSFEKFDKKITTIISSAGSAKSWSDLLPIIKEISSQLKKYNDFDFSELSNKILLSKRLAQCLHPNFPNGIHETTLNVYKQILTNIIKNHENKLMDNLGLYAYGLFPFFPIASINNKIFFLEEIVTPIFLKLISSEFKLCLPGLLSSLILGLDDNNEKTGNLIFKAFKDCITKDDGKLARHFYGVYWTLLLRNRHLRASGIKFLSNEITKYEEYEKLNDDEKKNIINIQYPNIDTTVINALCEVLKEEDIPVVRNGLDFILSRLPLSQKNNMITDKSKKRLLVNALSLLAKNEFSIIRRLKAWILGLENNDENINFDTEDMGYRMNLVIISFEKIFSIKKTYDAKTLSKNLKVIENFLEQDSNFINLILPKISYNILQCVVNYWENTLNGSENVNHDDVFDLLTNFLNKDEKYADCLWTALSDNLKKLCEKYKDEEINTESRENLFVEIEEILKPFKFCLLYNEVRSTESKIKYFVPIITYLLQLNKKIKITKTEELRQIKQITLIILVFVKSLQEKSKESKNKLKTAEKSKEKSGKNAKNQNLRKSLFRVMSRSEDFGNFEEVNKQDVYTICKEANIANILQKEENINNMNLLKESIIKYQEYYMNLLIIYLLLDKKQICKYEIFLFKQCSELMIRLQEYAEQSEIPHWVGVLEKIIFNENANTNVSLEAANIILDLNLSSLTKNAIFVKIKNDFLNKDLDSSIIDDNSVNDIMKKSGVKNKNCYELLLGKFYFILCKQINQNVVFDIVVKLSKCDKNKFNELVCNTFQYEDDLDMTVENIKIFSEFWKLANENYPEEKIFSKGGCIFKMIDYLDHKNPFIRYLSKTWLNQTNQQFDKIIDPILCTLLNDEITVKTENENTFFDIEFDSLKILDAFNKLKNIIRNSSIITFLINKNPDNHILKLGNFNFPKKDISYLRLLVNVTICYTNTKAQENLGEKFKKDIYSVNIASCEFIEFLLSKVENKQLLFDNATDIADPMLVLLDKAMDKKDEIMQMQSLNVLKELYFNANIDMIKFNKDNKNKIIYFLKTNLLKSALINGMTADYVYVRDNFLDFTKKGLEIFKSIVSFEEPEEINDFYELCSCFVTPLIECLIKKINFDNRNRVDTENFSHFDEKNNKVIFKNYCEEYKEYKTYDENDVLPILKEMKNILSYCHQENENIASDENINWNEHKKEIMNEQKSNNFLKFVLNSIIDSSADNNRIKNCFRQSSLYKNQIFNLLQSLLFTWSNQSDSYEVYDYCLNKNGILAFTKINSWNALDDFEIMEIQNDINKQPIKKVVLDIAFTLFKTDSIKFIENVLNLWCNIDKKNEKNISTDKQFKLSIIELLIAMNIPMKVLLYCVGIILQNTIVFDKQKKYKKVPREKCYETPYNDSVYEAKVFHFLYSYILLNPNVNFENSVNEVSEIWKEMINILENAINGTKILYSYCWMYELLQLTLERYDIQEISNDIKHDISDIFGDLTDKLTESVFHNKIDSKYVKDNKLVLPILPHIYSNIIKEEYPTENLYKKNLERNSQKKSQNTSKNLFNNKFSNDSISSAPKRETTNDNINQISAEDNFYQNFCTVFEQSSEYNDENSNNNQQFDALNSIYRKLAFITLKEDFYKIINYLYRDNTSIKKYFTEIIKGLLSFIKDNDEKNIFYSEYATDFLANLTQCSPETVTLGKSLIIDYLMSPSFFVTTPSKLHGWRKIISSLAENYQGILSDMINSMDNKFFMLKLNDNDEEKIRTLRRVSFIIYSCIKDKFSKEIDLIQTTAKKLLTEYGEKNPLEGEIFLIMRILFLRFSHDGVMKMIKDLWPIIFTELIKNIENVTNINNSLHLASESYKFIELLSLANIEEFCLYEWIFIMDTFDMNDLDTRNNDSLLSILLNDNQKIFKPYTLNIFKDMKFDVNDELLKIQKKGKNELYIKTQKDNIQDLQEEVQKFFYSIGEMNSYKVPVNYEQIEEVIEKDFIDNAGAKK